MEFLKQIKQNTILIIPSKIKEKVLTFIVQNKINTPFKIIEYENLKRLIFFDYNDDTVQYLKKKYKIKKEVAKTYLENMYYIDDSNSFNMNMLRKLKEELFETNQISKNPYFLDSLKQYNVLIFGIDILKKFDQEMIEILKKYTNVEIIENDTYPIDIAYSFSNKEEQIKYVFEKISDLLKQNIEIDKIKLANVEETDYFYMKRMSLAYNIPVYLKENTLYATNMYSDIKRSILENNLDDIKHFKYVDKLLSKINSIENIDNLEELLDEYAKEIYIDEKELALEIVDLHNNYFEEDEYVFILNCNASILPKTYKDEDYLYDRIKPAILENTYEKTFLEEKSCIIALNKIKNKVICFIKREGNTEYFKSPILENIKIETPISLYSTSSNLQNKLDYCYYLDQYYKFGTKSSSLSILKENYTIPYKEYNHTFKGLKQDHIFQDNSILLSYSSFNAFYECKFKYYLNYVLKLKDFEETYATYLGSLFHYVLEKSDEENFNIEEEIKKYRLQNEKTFSHKEEFFLKENEEDLKEVILFKENFKNHTALKIEENETKLYTKIPSKMNVTMMGIIDKKYQDEEGRIAVVDYKTGNTKLNLKDTYHGLCMQLPIYYYLLKKNYPNMEIVGFYLQNILEKNFKNKKGKTKKEQKQDSLKLNGYSTSFIESLEKLDPTYKDSRFIMGLKMGNNGFYPYSKVLNDKQLDGLFLLVDNKIKEMVKSLEEKDFKINPKKLRKENISCKFCPYKSICFMDDTDTLELEEMKTLSFLGGDDYA